MPTLKKRPLLFTIFLRSYANRLSFFQALKRTRKDKMNSLKVVRNLFNTRHFGPVTLNDCSGMGAIVSPTTVDDLPQFDIVLFGVPGRGGCNSNCNRPPSQDQQETSDNSSGSRYEQCDNKITCPPPQRPPQPSHCLKTTAYPPKQKNCSGACKRPGGANCNGKR